MADKVVYTYMVADLLHFGHLRALQQARALGNYLIVGVITDEGVEAYKRKPVIPFGERIELIQNLKCVDWAVKQTGVDPTENLIKYDPDVLTHGDDWGDDFPGAEYMRTHGKEAIRTKYYKGNSTTNIISTIEEDYVTFSLQEVCEKYPDR